MSEKPQPETLQVIVDGLNEHQDIDGSVGCEGGARSSSRASTIFSDEPSEPIDETIKKWVSKITKK